jgi:two-component system, NarL family, nitrate/nitrite response regulator NarL
VQLRVLIVDDNGGFLYAARRLLAREGLQVVGIAGTGDEALRRVDTFHPDVVLVDIVLDGESGFDVARRLLAREGPPVILVSTHTEDDLGELVDESPAIGFLPKAALSAAAIRGILDLSQAGGATSRRDR